MIQRRMEKPMMKIHKLLNGHLYLLGILVISLFLINVSFSALPIMSGESGVYVETVMGGNMAKPGIHGTFFPLYFFKPIFEIDPLLVRFISPLFFLIGIILAWKMSENILEKRYRF